MKKVSVFLQVDASIIVDLNVPDDATDEEIIKMAYNKADRSDLEFGDFVPGGEEIIEDLYNEKIKL